MDTRDDEKSWAIRLARLYRAGDSPVPTVEQLMELLPERERAHFQRIIEPK